MVENPEIEQAPNARLALDFCLKQVQEAEETLQRFRDGEKITIHSVMEIHTALGQIKAAVNLVDGSLEQAK